MERGGFNVLLGATNAGKSTLIRLLGGLEKPTTGEAWMDGKNVTGVSPQRRNISLVHQFFANCPHLSVYDNIASPLRAAGTAKDEIDRRVRETAKLLRLEPLLDRPPQQLSGGQQQRAALARAIVKQSAAVFLDEPLANLDYKLRELFANRGAIVVYAASEPSEALMRGGRTALMHAGSIVQFGKTAAVYRAPANRISAIVFSDRILFQTPAASTTYFCLTQAALRRKLLRPPNMPEL